MGYRFRLEALKRYRHFQEETCQKEFADAQRLYEQEVRALAALVELRSKTEAQMSREKHTKTTGAHMTMVTQYLERLARQIEERQREMRKAQKKCEKKRQGLIAAMQKRKTLEKLKAHGLSAYLQHLDHEEEKFISEMAINRHILNTK